MLQQQGQLMLQQQQQQQQQQQLQQVLLTTGTVGISRCTDSHRVFRGCVGRDSRLPASLQYHSLQLALCTAQARRLRLATTTVREGRSNAPSASILRVFSRRCGADGAAWGETYCRQCLDYPPYAA